MLLNNSMSNTIDKLIRSLKSIDEYLYFGSYTINAKHIEDTPISYKFINNKKSIILIPDDMDWEISLHLKHKTSGIDVVYVEMEHKYQIAKFEFIKDDWMILGMTGDNDRDMKVIRVVANILDSFARFSFDDIMKGEPLPESVLMEIDTVYNHIFGNGKKI